MYSGLERRGAFWLFQIGGWTAYATILFLSSIPFANDRGAVAYRVTLGVSCLAGSFVLHAVCQRQWRQGVRFPGSIMIVLGWSALLTCLCAALALKAEYVFGSQLRPFTPLIALTAITSAGFIFLSWSALYFGIKYYQAVECERRRVLAAEASARASELRALRYQVHPHFLFNTLNAISTLVTEGQNQAATAMISRLADFFRATLDGPAADEVSLGNELVLTRQYLEIEQLRLGDRLQFDMGIDPALLVCLVPHLILQPLVENSIRHGIAPRRGAGQISIVAKRDRANLIVAVTDDGLGKQLRGQAQNGRHIGLKNIDQRLRDLYGDSGGLELVWPPGGGCQAILTIPYHQESYLPLDRQ